MSDLISREDAIDACCRGWNNTAEDCIRNIKELPSAELPKGELISRADAIGIIEDYIGKDYMTPMSRIYSARSELSALPSAEYSKPLQTTLNGDLVSRTDAIEAIQTAYCTPCKERGDDHNEVRCRVCEFDGAMMQIDIVPSAEAEWIPFRDDLLIRENAAEAVGEFFNEMDISLFGRTGVRLARNVLNSVPTVAPLKWIPLNKDGHEPLFEGDYLLCLDDGYITSVYFDGNDWELWADSGEPVAWMPLPTPYKGGDTE